MNTRILNETRNHLAYSLFSILMIFFSFLGIKSNAQIRPLISCSISGNSSVSLGGTYTYNLIGGCSATSWSVTCGTIQSSNSTSVTIHFNMTGCSSSTITANGTAAPPKTVTVTWSPLSGGTISNSSQSINYNTAPSQINASSASGGDCFSYSYQWYYSTDNFDFISISGATGLNYQPGTLTTTTYYKRKVTCSGSSVFTSNTATVTVYPQLNPGSVSTAQTIDFNTSPSTLSLSGVSGGSGTYTYVWQYSLDNSTWIPISGATSTTYAPGALSSNTYYNVAVTSNGYTANSSSVLITVNPQLLPGVITPENINITSGTSPGQLNCTPASGGSCGGSYSFQWQNSTNGTSFSDITGATSLNYTPSTLSTTTWFRRKVTCGSDVEYSTVCEVTVGSTSANLNFVRVRDVLKAGVTDTVTADGLSSSFDVAQTTQYYDGLGRMVQSVEKSASPDQEDMVTPVVYDDFGRQAIHYLPYTASSSDGNYKSTALVDQYNFNSSQFSGEEYYYGETNFEASPLNRPLSSEAPGSNWIGSGRGISTQYLFNAASDSVRIWVISSTQQSIPSTSSTYAAGQLYKTVLTDEQGRELLIGA